MSDKVFGYWCYREGMDGGCVMYIEDDGSCGLSLTTDWFGLMIMGMG